MLNKDGSKESFRLVEFSKLIFCYNDNSLTMDKMNNTERNGGKKLILSLERVYTPTVFLP